MQGPQPNLDAALGSSAGVQRSGRRVLEALSLSLSACTYAYAYILHWY